MKETIKLFTIFKLSFGIIILAAGGFALAQEQSEYLSVTGPCNLEFPGDHGPHFGYRTEWWYYTGNLTSEKGSPYGFQFTIFRSQISPPGFEKKWPQPSSAWRTQQIYLGHVAVTDISGKQHLQGEKTARAALGLSAAAHTRAITDIFIDDWSIRITPDSHILKVTTDDFKYEFYLLPEKIPVMHGDAGYSRKGSRTDQASCYYSFTRLKTEGIITVDGKTESVSGFSWMDHEYSTAALDPGLVGWDWFSLQLSDNTEVMLYLLRAKNGKIHPASSGSRVNANGEVLHLAQNDFNVKVSKTWRSPQTDAVYPAHWRIQIPSLALDLIVSPNLPDQEMRTWQSTGVTYWEGSVSLTGTKQDQSLTGQGYVELTGYARSFDAPI
ncbi:MAG: carotenoid 1,2-hydratase [Deltaproteobacteria bacterium]|jgi:predicted secreted hydrolase|nr:carotenoid 1,2-hydratase [Deltaproteobacteria bacterium]